MNKSRKQMSDSLICGVLLALSGGGMDAYSYIFRDHVFANAQTGNMLLFGVNLASGDMPQAVKYFWPILAFAVGIFFADMTKNKGKFNRLHWRQISVAIEAVILIAVAFMPESYNQLANALTSFACGIQVESFRKIHGNVIATTMCIGNMRSGTFYLDEFIHKKEKRFLRKTALYYGIIVAFVCGAIIESILLKSFQQYAILMSTFLLVVVFLIMHIPADE